MESSAKKPSVNTGSLSERSTVLQKDGKDQIPSVKDIRVSEEKSLQRQVPALTLDAGVTTMEKRFLAH